MIAICTKCIRHRYRHRYRYRSRNRCRHLWTLEKLAHCRILPPFTLSLSPLFPPLMSSSCPPHTCMRAATHLHTHTRTVGQNGPVAGVREQARGSSEGADGGDQARGRPGPAGRARGVTGSVHGVRSADKERGRGRARNLVVVLGMHYWDQVISCREEGHGGGRALTFACAYLRRIRVTTASTSNRRYTRPVQTAWRARWRRFWRTARMPRLQTR